MVAIAGTPLTGEGSADSLQAAFEDRGGEKPIAISALWGPKTKHPLVLESWSGLDAWEIHNVEGTRKATQLFGHLHLHIKRTLKI